jgi:hypothetical protein
LRDPHIVQLLPGERLLLAEGDAITERHIREGIRWRKETGWVNGCRRLLNGNTFVATERCVYELTPEGTEVNKCELRGGWERLESGRILCWGINEPMREFDLKKGIGRGRVA